MINNNTCPLCGQPLEVDDQGQAVRFTVPKWKTVKDKQGKPVHYVDRTCWEKLRQPPERKAA
jgi:hypothetical protein